jgi:hypothetical protein
LENKQANKITKKLAYHHQPRSPKGITTRRRILLQKKETKINHIKDKATKEPPIP